LLKIKIQASVDKGSAAWKFKNSLAHKSALNISPMHVSTVRCFLFILIIFEAVPLKTCSWLRLQNNLVPKFSHVTDIFICFLLKIISHPRSTKVYNEMKVHPFCMFFTSKS
jgi:hypothetical protein